MDEFDVNDWDSLTRLERIRRCGLWAEEAQNFAKSASPAMAEVYLRLARAWVALAVEIEANLTEIDHINSRSQ